MHGDFAKHTTRKFRQVIAVPGLDGHTEQMNQTLRSSHKVLRLKPLHKTLLRRRGSYYPEFHHNSDGGLWVV